MTHPDTTPPRPSHAKRRRLTTVPIRTRIGSWNVFERRFKPIVREDGSLIWERSELPADIEPRQWWTVLDCEGRLYLSPGFRGATRPQARQLTSQIIWPPKPTGSKVSSRPSTPPSSPHRKPAFRPRSSILPPPTPARSACN